jgi:glycosyltransferase involved in cell wall biosynthesis
VQIKNPFPLKAPAILEKDTFTFLFAGRFVSYKNLPLVLRAFGTVAARHDNVHLVLIGDGPEEAALKRQAATLGGKVAILPKVDQKTLFTRINASSVALAPALTEFNPNFILEALALGKPVLISRDNGLSAQLPEYMQFNPMDHASLEGAMERLLSATDYRAAVDFVAQLPMGQTWDKVVAEHEGIVKKLI